MSFKPTCHLHSEREVNVTVSSLIINLSLSKQGQRQASKLGVVVHAVFSATLELEAKVSGVQGQLQSYTTLETRVDQLFGLYSYL